MDSGELRRHILRASKVYTERRDILKDLINKELGAWVDFDLPEGGLAFWLRLKSSIKMKVFNKHALFEKVHFSPGSLFSEDAQEINAIRLGFASLNIKELIEGIQRIKRALIKSS